MATLTEDIKRYANKHYEDSFACQTIVECFDDEEIEDLFPSMDDFMNYVEAKDGQYSDITAEIF
jgi:hypothetical protein